MWRSIKKRWGRNNMKSTGVKSTARVARHRLSITKQRPFKAMGIASYLVRCLIGIVYGILVASSEQQDAGTVFEVVHGTHVERCVARGILGIHVGSIKK